MEAERPLDGGVKFVWVVHDKVDNDIAGVFEDREAAISFKRVFCGGKGDFADRWVVVEKAMLNPAPATYHEIAVRRQTGRLFAVNP